MLHDQHIQQNQSIAIGVSVWAGQVLRTCEDRWRGPLLEAAHPGLCTALLPQQESVCMWENWSKNTTAALLGYAQQNMALVSLYYREPFVTVLLVDEDTSYMDLIAGIGGLLGLCMGFSFVTIGEICYFTALAILREMCRHFRCGRKNKLRNIQLQRGIDDQSFKSEILY